MGRDGRADLPAEHNESAVQPYPQTAGDHCFEGELGGFGSAGLHPAQPVRNSMHMNVYANAGLAETQSEREIRRFRSYARKTKKPLPRTGHPLLRDDLGHMLDLTGLRVVEAARKYETLDFISWKLRKRGGIGGTLEKAGGGREGYLVLRAQRNDGGDEDLEWIGGALGNLGYRGKIALNAFLDEGKG